MSQEFDLAEWLWLRSLKRLQLRSQLRLKAFGGLIRAGGFTSKVTYSHTWQVRTGCSQESFIPCLIDFFRGLIEYPYNMASGFLQSKWSKKATVSFMTKLRSHTLLFPHILLVTLRSPIQCGEAVYKGANIRRCKYKVMKPSLRLVTTGGHLLFKVMSKSPELG